MLIQPEFLKKNDKVAIIATSNNFEPDLLNKGIDIIKNWDLEVVLGKNLFNQFNQFAGTDDERYEDLQSTLDDNNIKAIFIVRGGYGISRIIDRVDFSKFKNNPKWIIGYSDVTVLHSNINKIGYQSIHGIMPLFYGKSECKKSVKKLKDILFGKTFKYKLTKHPLNKEGFVKSEIIGGNLSTIISLIGTKSDIDFNNKILFIEDINEKLYSIDRMMIQLKRTRKLDKLSGLIVGSFSNILDNKIPFGKNSYEIIYDIVKEFNYPVIFNFPAGHEDLNFPIILGKEYTLNNTKKHIIIE